MKKLKITFNHPYILEYIIFDMDNITHEFREFRIKFPKYYKHIQKVELL